MGKRIQNRIVLTRMDKPSDRLSLKPNEAIVMEHWKVSYEGLSIKEHPRGELQTYREIIDGINSTRQDEPNKITISFKPNKKY